MRLPRPLRLVLMIALACALFCCGRNGEDRAQAVQPASVGPADMPQGLPPADPNAETLVGPPLPVEEEPPAEIVLFFADTDGYPEPEIREVPPGGTLGQRVRRLVEEMAAGPENGALSPVLPADAALREFYLTTDKTGFLDMNAAFEIGLSSGSEDAILAVRCLADAVAATFPEVERIKILVEGVEPREFGGHLDLSRPFEPGPRMEPPDPGSGLPL